MHRPTFDLRLLTSFVVLAEELHFGHAADRLSLAQSALSRQIARLEQQLDTTLLIRSSKEVRLTPAGEQLVIAGREMLTRAIRAEAAVHIDGGELTIHVGDGLNPRLVQSVTTFGAANPGLRLSVIEGPLSAGSQAVASGEADVGISTPQEVLPGLAYTTLDRSPLGVAFPDDHRFAESENVHWRHLDGERLFVPPPGFADSYHTVLREALRRVDARHLEVLGPMAKASYLEAHIVAHQGILVCPDYVTAEWPNTISWHALNPVVLCEVGLTWNKRTVSETTQRFVNWMAGKLTPPV